MQWIWFFVVNFVVDDENICVANNFIVKIFFSYSVWPPYIRSECWVRSVTTNMYIKGDSLYAILAVKNAKSIKEIPNCWTFNTGSNNVIPLLFLIFTERQIKWLIILLNMHIRENALGWQINLFILNYLPFCRLTGKVFSEAEDSQAAILNASSISWRVSGEVYFDKDCSPV